MVDKSALVDTLRVLAAHPYSSGRRFSTHACSFRGLVRPLRQTGPTLSFDAFAPAAWLLLHLFVYPKLTHAPVRRLVWLVRHTETVHLHSE